MRTAIIFGVTGQDGSYLSELLLEKGYRVVGVSRRTSTPNDARIRHLLGNPNFEVVRGDVTDAFSVWSIVGREKHLTLGAPPVLDARLEVYNLAAQSHVADSFVVPVNTAAVDYLGAMNCLEAVRSLGKDGRVRFYQASSSEMFGSSYSLRWAGLGVRHHDLRRRPLNGPYAEAAFQGEETPMLPCSPYAVAKLAAHHLVRVYRESYGVFACSGILFNHESERRSEQFVTRKITKYVGEFVRWKKGVEASEPGGVSFDYELSPGCVSSVRLNRDGESYGHRDSWLFGPRFPKLKLGNLKASRDWGHAEDHVRAMWLMLQQDEPDDYVVATGETHTVEEFLLKAFAVAGLKAERVECLPVEIDPALFRPCEVPYLKGDASKARGKLGWSPRVSFDRLVERMVYADL